MSYNQNELAGLSDAERAALMDDDDQADTGDLDGREAGPTGEPDYDVMQQMAASTVHPDSITEYMRKLAEQRDALETAYEEGESDLTFAEYKAKLRELNEATLAASGNLAESRLVHRMATESAKNEWLRQINDYRREARRIGLDMDRDPELARQWDRAVKFLGNDPDNADKSMDWFLSEALKMVAVRHGKLKSAHDPFLPARDMGRTVNVPGGIDGLKGMDLEKALARMSPEEAEHWLTS